MYLVALEELRILMQQLRLSPSIVYTIIPENCSFRVAVWPWNSWPIALVAYTNTYNVPVLTFSRPHCGWNSRAAVAAGKASTVPMLSPNFARYLAVELTLNLQTGNTDIWFFLICAPNSDSKQLRQQNEGLLNKVRFLLLNRFQWII